jgi:S-adenosylmethionine hydrolase
MTLITLTTDFGATDPFVGIMKGVIASRAPAAVVIDLAHGIPPQDVFAGALVLQKAVPYFPAGTIHVGVVDPGVGGSRRPLCVETVRGCLVGPDNGLLSMAAPAAEVRRIVHLTETRFFLEPVSATFHGRDLFAPVAAALATGTAPSELGPEVPSMEQLDLPPVVREGRTIRGQVLYIDHFGNLVTNVSSATLDAMPRNVTLRVRGLHLQAVAPSYAAVGPGQPVAVVNSWGLLEVAVRDGSARDRLGARIGDPVVLEPR